MTDSIIENRRVALNKKRVRSEKRFKMYGIGALVFAGMVLLILFGSIIFEGIGSFSKTQILVSVSFDREFLSLQEGEQPNYYRALRVSFKSMFNDVGDSSDTKKLNKLLSQVGEGELERYLEANPAAKSKTAEVWVTASSLVDQFIKGKVDENLPELERPLSDKQIGWIKKLKSEKRIRKVFNAEFFKMADSRKPEFAGIAGSIIGSLLTVAACIAISLPIGVMTALYLQEFARKNKITEIIDLNISNLAAVPSIIFGLIGLGIYISFFGVPRSSSLAGGLTLSMMILPTIIISTRAALSAVPDSIRDAARAVGASEMQVVFHHVLPLAVPGIMTGVILGISRALGETAPLLMIGMVAFIADIPTGILEPATTMPVQVYLWADNPQIAFAEKTAGCIIVLLVVLLALNSLAIYMRRRFERRW